MNVPRIVFIKWNRHSAILDISDIGKDQKGRIHLAMRTIIHIFHWQYDLGLYFNVTNFSKSFIQFI